VKVSGYAFWEGSAFPISLPQRHTWILSAAKCEWMAKDSNKYRVLVRRTQELDHAIRHGFPAEKVHERAEKLRAAVLAVLKKRGFAAGDSLRAWWERLSVEEILAVAAGWGPQPSFREIRLVDQGEGLKHAAPGTSSAEAVE
jgi:hypothetical protein